MTKREKLSSISLSTSFDEPILLHAHDSHLDTNGRHVYSQPGEGNWTSHCGLIVWPCHPPWVPGASMASDSTQSRIFSSRHCPLLNDLEATIQAGKNPFVDSSRSGAICRRAGCEQGLDII